MKKILLFIAGVATGIVLTFLISFVIAAATKSSGDNGITWLEKTGDRLEADQFEVFQVLETGVALANARDMTQHYFVSFTGPVVLLVNYEGKHYYDDEVVKVPKGKFARQVGIYQYETKSDYEKTVPVVKIVDK